MAAQGWSPVPADASAWTPVPEAPKAEDTRSLYQKAKDSFNANTQGAKPGDGAVKGFIENVGAGGGDFIRSAAHAIEHPIEAAKAAGEEYSNKPIGEQVLRAVTGPAANLYDIGKGLVTQPGRTIGQLGTGAIAGEIAAPVIGAGVNALKAAPEAVGDAASAARQYVRPKSSPAIVPPEEIQAQKIAQSILPPGGIKPELVKSIQAEAPAIVEYAQRTGNPLNTQAEGLKAAQGVAQEGLQHYQDEVLKPVEGRSVALDAKNTELGDKATIGDIDTRITKLNKLINTAPANSAGAALDVIAKSKWGDEVSYLRQKLYSSLEHTTGIPATDIQQLREGYGGEFSLANGLEAAQNARLTRTGGSSQGVKTIGSVPTSLAEIPGKALQVAKGGEQAIADRQFASAIKQVQPQAPIRPTPPPIDTDALAAQQAQAQQEFLRAHQSEQAAQDASAQRSVVAEDARVRSAAQMRAKALADFEARKVAGEKARQEAYERSKTR